MHSQGHCQLPGGMWAQAESWLQAPEKLCGSALCSMGCSSSTSVTSQPKCMKTHLRACSAEEFTLWQHRHIKASVWPLHLPTSSLWKLSYAFFTLSSARHYYTTLLKIIFIFILFGRQREREKERISTIGSLPQMLTTPAAGPHGTKSYKLSLQYECLGSKSWSHHRRPPRVQKTRAEAKETTSHSRVPNGNLTPDQTFACITPLPRLLKLSGVPAVLVLKLDSPSCFCKITLRHAIYQARIFFSSKSKSVLHTSNIKFYVFTEFYTC